MYCKPAKTICIFLLSCLMTACNEREDTAITSDGRVAVSFAAGISTRVSNTSWEDNDKIGVTMLYSGTIITATETFNRQYQVSSPGAVASFLPQSPTETIYYPNDESKVDFIAYYPFPAGLKSLKAYPLSLADQNDRKSIDLLVAKTAGVGKDRPNVSLNFSHQLSSLEFKIYPGEVGSIENLAGAILTIKDIPVSAIYDLSNGEVTPIETNDIAASMDASGTEGKAIVFPRKQENEVWFEIRLKSGSTFSAYLNRESEWEPGTRYTYSITLRRTPVLADMTVSITDWVNDAQQGKLE